MLVFHAFEIDDKYGEFEIDDKYVKFGIVGKYTQNDIIADIIGLLNISVESDENECAVTSDIYACRMLNSQSYADVLNSDGYSQVYVHRLRYFQNMIDSKRILQVYVNIEV